MKHYKHVCTESGSMQILTLASHRLVKLVLFPMTFSLYHGCGWGYFNCIDRWHVLYSFRFLVHGMLLNERKDYRHKESQSTKVAGVDAIMSYTLGLGCTSFFHHFMGSTLALLLRLTPGGFGPYMSECKMIRTSNHRF